MRVVLVIPGLVLLFAGIYCILGKDVSAGTNPFDVVPRWVGAIACAVGIGVIIYGAGRRKF